MVISYCLISLKLLFVLTNASGRIFPFSQLPLDCWWWAEKRHQARWPSFSELFSSWNRPAVLASAFKAVARSPLYCSCCCILSATLKRAASPGKALVAFLLVGALLSHIQVEGRWLFRKIQEGWSSKGQALLSSVERKRWTWRKEASQEGKEWLGIFMKTAIDGHGRQCHLEKVHFKYLWHKRGHGKVQQEVVAQTWFMLCQKPGGAERDPGFRSRKSRS